MSSGKERTADLILAAAAAAAAAASFLPASFASGLLFHSALAAAAGGAADWFAVNSLFRKPLGFSFRTELVPKSRDKIIRMARDMLEREILTVPRIYKVFKNHSISLALTAWAAENRDILRAAAEQAAGVCLRALDKKAAAELGAEAAEKLYETRIGLNFFRAPWKAPRAWREAKLFFMPSGAAHGYSCRMVLRMKNC